MSDMITLAAGPLTLDIAPGVGGSIARFDAGGAPLMRPAPTGYADVLDAACFPLVPFCNRVRDGRFAFRGRTVQLDAMAGQRHPLHGQGWRAPWSVLSADREIAVLAYDHAPADWPWRYRAEQAFSLDPAGLTLRLSMHNLDDQPQPCGLGLHPYFPCDGDTTLDTLVDGVWTIDTEVMPVERRPATGRYALRERRICGADLDNGFDGWGGHTAVRWPGRGLGLDITAPEARYAQVYAPSAGGLFVAEAVTHVNAALNLPEDQWAGAGLVVLAPGQTHTLTTRFAVRTHA